MLIFFDIDGTLIDIRTHIMPESAVRAVAAAKRNGHICAVNTGRTGKTLEPDRERLNGFDAFIMGCGTMITCGEKILSHRTFSVPESVEIIDALHRYRIDAVLEGCENNYYDDYDKIFSKWFEGFVRRFADQGCGSFRDAVGCFDKVTIFAEDAARVKAFQEEFEGRLDFVDRQRGFFEVMPKGYSKASAMKVLADALNVPMTQTAALGDSTNDLPMLECAHIGIAMGNASEDVKAAADFVTTDIEKDGVWNALDRLGVL